jgi:hypothetical protein
MGKWTLVELDLGLVSEGLRSVNHPKVVAACFRQRRPQAPAADHSTTVPHAARDVAPRSHGLMCHPKPCTVECSMLVTNTDAHGQLGGPEYPIGRRSQWARVRGSRPTILLEGRSVPTRTGDGRNLACATAGMCPLPLPYDRGSD